LCYVDFEEEFTKLIDIDNITDSAFAYVTVNNKYINFKVINQRRVDIHNAVALNVSIYDKVSCPCIKSCDNSKLKYEKINKSSIINSSVNKLEFDEEFTVPSDSKPIKRIVSSTSFVTLTDTKIIKDKALIKATANISVLYTTDDTNEELSKCEYSFNVSKIVDALGVSDNDFIISSINIGNIFFKAKSSSNDKLCVIEAYGDISISSVFIRESQEDIIVDGYVVNHNCDGKYSDYSCNMNGRFIKDTKIENLSFELTNQVNEIKELGISLSDAYVRNGKLFSKATANVICITTDNNLTSCSSSNDIEIELDNCNNAIATLSIQSYDYTINSNGKIDVRLSFLVSAYVFEESKIKVMSDLIVNDEIDTSVLTIYFAKQNESIWSIAKKLSSDVDIIKSENNLTTDSLDNDCVLIIPAI
jgi:hypothetical protein